WFDGAPEIKITSRSRSRAARFASWLAGADTAHIVYMDFSEQKAVSIITARPLLAENRRADSAKCRMHDGPSCKLHENENLVNL
ncbi:hypothetical protein, partial [Pseudomonas sp. L13]|uniref:hypothetical protein n=1 Tax=Pseudomonas sp. L13 TaxID=343985 RepID=UPI001C49A36A